MEQRLQNIKSEALAQIMGAQGLEDLENLRITYLGRKGELNTIIQQIPQIPIEQRGIVGRIANDVKGVIEQTLQERQNELKTRRKGEWFDPTIPGEKPSTGHLHLVTQAAEEIQRIFERIGFVRARYPEVEWDWYAFESLNMPENHPARDEWETFFADTPAHPKYGQMVLTPHTSSGQVREMQKVKEPPMKLPALGGGSSKLHKQILLVNDSPFGAREANLRFKNRSIPGSLIRTIIIGKCYRRQSDASHLPMFHQVEGLAIDKGISIAHLKGTVDYFVKSFFGSGRKTRLRPFHFQFTEPSFEVDISCAVCSGVGCKLCKAGWLELGGAGMVHPVVLKNGGIDPKKYTGFAFGLGLERTYMMKSGLKIGDIRMLYNTDLRFLRQF